MAALLCASAIAPASAGSLEYRIPLKGLRAASETVEPSPVSIQSYGAYRGWSDNTYADSCLTYRNPPENYDYSGATGDGVYRIDLPDGSEVDMHCDMSTDGGGWTRVAQITGSGTATAMPTVAINDRNLSFTEVLLVAGTAKFSNYQTAKTQEYKGPGVNIAWDGLRFGANWYFAANTPTWRGYGANSASPYALNLTGSVAWPNNLYSVLAPAQSMCRFQQPVEAVGFCGMAVKVQAPSGLRLTGFNDIESLANNVSDNHIVRDVDIFVR